MKSLDFDIEERAEQAVRNFEEGYNCAQSVFLAYYDVLGLDFELARNMSVSFGAGVGRMREVCGTVSAMAMLAGFKHPVEDPSDMDARARNYGMVQKMAALFKEQFGTIICRDTREYYAKRPCGKYIAEAARIAGRMLKGELTDD